MLRGSVTLTKIIPLSELRPEFWDHRSFIKEAIALVEGTVKWFNAMKGFGFITPEEGGKDVFVHQSALDPETVLAEGDEVEFEIGDSPKGPQAKNVKKL